MTFEFRPAMREKTSTLIALAGPTGCGKTYTAILMGMGLAYPNMTNDEILATIEQEGHSRIYFIDTEGSRGLHYAAGPNQTPDFVKTFPYLYGEIRAPYTPEAYKEAITAADEAGAWVIIVDSTSHEYEGEGGILEIADQYEQGIPKAGIKNPRDPKSGDGWKDWEVKPDPSAGKWKVPKTRHKQFVNRAIQARSHVIFCLRAEDKMLMQNVPQFNDDGSPKMWNGKHQTKSVVIPAQDRPVLERWQPICEKRFMYEMTVSFLLLPERPGFGVPIKTLQSAFESIFAQGGKMLGRAEGEALAQWSMGRAATAINARPPGSGGGGNPATEGGGKPKRTNEQMVDDYVAALKRTSSIEQMQEFQTGAASFVERLRGNPDLSKLWDRIIEENMAHRDILMESQGDEQGDLIGGDDA